MKAVQVKVNVDGHFIDVYTASRALHKRLYSDSWPATISRPIHTDKKVIE
jgi:hypothetical protein